MAFTFEYRRSTILQENLPPKQLLNRWPAIGMYDEVIDYITYLLNRNSAI